MKTAVRPAGCLREFVTNYVLIEETVTAESPIVAASDVSLDFLVGDRAHVFNHRLRRAVDIPSTLVRGPQTQRWVDLQPMSRHIAFFVRFQPGGFQRLFGTDLVELSDHGYSALDVIGPEVGALRDAIAEAPTVHAKVRVAEAFLLARAAFARAERAVHRAARLLAENHGRLHAAGLVEATGVGDRQFRREFHRQLGMSPKRYAKIERFSYALRLKESCPQLSWAEVSAEAGYFDQMHFVKDCKVLGGAVPTCLMDIAAMRPFCDRQINFAGPAKDSHPKPMGIDDVS